MNTQTTKRTHFPRTTASQRKLLFQTWQATDDVQLACHKAHVSERTYYNWKPRFEKAGYQGLEQFASHAPKNPRRTAQTIQQKVIHLRRTHPKWGKRRIADEMAKANNWVPLVSPNTVRRILIEAGLWERIQTKPKKPVQARTADKPEQSVNIDLCFIPATHETHEVVSKLPAVSGSSGRLVVERTLDQAAKEEPTWPGRVFEQQNLTYEQAMEAFVDASANKSSLPSAAKSPEAIAAAAVLEQKRQIRQEEEALRAEKRTVRQKRQLEDQAWLAIREQRRAQQAHSPAALVQRPANSMAPQTDLTEPQTDPIEPQTDPIEPQTDPIEPQTNPFKRQTSSQQADSITQQTRPIAKTSEQPESCDAQTTLMAITPRPSLSVARQAPPMALTEKPAALVDPVTLTQMPVDSVSQQAASLSSLVLAIQPAAPAAQQATEALQQATEVVQQAAEATQQAIEATQQTTEATQQTTEATQQTTEATQQTTEAIRQIGSTMRSTASVTQPTALVTQPTASGTQSMAAATQPTAVVAQSTAPTTEPTASVAQLVAKEEAKNTGKRDICDGQWRQMKLARQVEKEQRKKEDIEWRQKRNSILQRLGQLPLITAWLAILVIVDNCTRQCISLPLFMVGPHVTAKMVVDALREVLPAELQYLISDRGIHFRANIFSQFCQMSGFQHVLIAKHRPQSNGIAERFVRTLKEWLADKSWTSEEELIALLTEFREYYNDRPHQGIAMPGLSPNEYAKRIWLQ